MREKRIPVGTQVGKKSSSVRSKSKTHPDIASASPTNIVLQEQNPKNGRQGCYHDYRLSTK